MDPFRIVWPQCKNNFKKSYGFIKPQILSALCDAFVVVVESILIRKIKSYASGHGACFLGSGSTFSLPAEDGLDYSSFFTNYKVFSHSQRRAKANDPAMVALMPDQVPLDHLP